MPLRHNVGHVVAVFNPADLKSIPVCGMTTTASTSPKVAIVCAAQGLAAALAHHLRSVDWVFVDPTGADLAEDLAGMDAVVHAWIDPDLSVPDPFRGDLSAALTAKLLSTCSQVGTKHVILLSSAMVYGASPTNSIPLKDDAPLRANGEVGVVQDLLDAEEQFRQWANQSDSCVSIVRPAVVFGDSIDTAFVRHFEAPRLLFLKGSVPAWQFVHIDDLATALECVVENSIAGVVPVGASGWLMQEEIEAISGISRLELPAAAVMSTASRLHHHGVTPAPAEELDFIRYPWVIDSTVLTNYGWTASWTNQRVVEALMEQAQGRIAIAGRRVGRSEVTALTAAAAVLTAAALLRARRRRGV